ncbi:hypothetical protein ACGF5O_34230 [Streptomyces sp. NPDC048291]|uniref:hypothetical protein n=1 Tax=Streptomyces sp. NPDC048291 TaxID=3365530 RepID=UPI003711CB66
MPGLSVATWQKVVLGVVTVVAAAVVGAPVVAAVGQWVPPVLTRGEVAALDRRLIEPGQSNRV